MRVSLNCGCVVLTFTCVATLRSITLLRHRNELYRSSVFARFGVLYKTYRPRFYYYTVVLLAKRLALVLASVFFSRMQVRKADVLQHRARCCFVLVQCETGLIVQCETGLIFAVLLQSLQLPLFMVPLGLSLVLAFHYRPYHHRIYTVVELMFDAALIVVMLIGTATYMVDFPRESPL